jgi:hypothetical protein
VNKSQLMHKQNNNLKKKSDKSLSQNQISRSLERLRTMRVMTIIKETANKNKFSMTNRLMNRKRVKLRAKIKMEKDKEKCSQEWSRSKCNRCKWIQIKKSSSKMASNTSNKIK